MEIRNFTVNNISSMTCTFQYDGSPGARAPKIALYLVLIIASIVGNVLVLCVVYNKKKMWKVKNFFITNLSGSDLLVTVFCMPFMISHEFLFDKWVFGTAMCKMIPFLQNTSVASSVLTLLAIAIDRFTAIAFVNGPRLNLFRAKIVVCFVWFSAVVVATPTLYAQRVIKGNGGYEVCIEDWTPMFDSARAAKYYTILLFLTLYIAPLLTMAFLYAVLCFKLWNQTPPGESCGGCRKRNKATKKKAILMLITVSAAFAVSWLPYWVFYLAANLSRPHPCFTSNVNLIFVVMLFGHANSVMNPICYSFLSVQFRKGFKEAFTCKTSCQQSASRHCSAKEQHNNELFRARQGKVTVI